MSLYLQHQQVNDDFMNCFCGMVDRRKTFNLISSRDHCQRSSSSWISYMPWAGFEPAQNLSSGFVERNCLVVITIAPRRHDWIWRNTIWTLYLKKSGLKSDKERGKIFLFDSSKLRKQHLNYPENVIYGHLTINSFKLSLVQYLNWSQERLTFF